MNINCIGPIYYRFRKGEIFFELWFGVHFFELTSVDFFIEEREKQFCRALWSGVQPFCVDFWFSLFSILYSFVPIFIFVCCCFSSFFFSYFSFFLFSIFYFLFFCFQFFYFSFFLFFLFSIVPFPFPFPIFFFFCLLFIIHCFFWPFVSHLELFWVYSHPLFHTHLKIYDPPNTPSTS